MPARSCTLLLVLCLALVASATADGSHKPSHKPRHGSCHLRRYACVDRHSFCNGGVVQQCPAGTTCVTQYGKNILKVSPCVTRSSHRSLLTNQHKPSHTTPRCHLANYVCVPPGKHQKTSNRFCLGGYSMACPAGTFCRTQPPHRRQSVSPCVSH